MAPLVHGFDPPERFVAGTVGPPGHRTFFLQARAGARMTSVALEKQQVAVLAERIDELLDEVMASPGNTALIPAVAPLDLDDAEPLDQPIEEEFRAGTMTLAWDGTSQRIIIEVFPFVEATEVPDDVGDDVEVELEEPDPEEVFVVRITAGAARAFVKRAAAVVEAGRPSCPFCGNPIDPEGHLCVRANGFRRRDP
jgi:uncharacterized repeat protein (TIGR03847 family)